MSAAVPDRNATAASSGTDSRSSAHATGMEPSSRACARSEPIMIQRLLRPSSAWPATIEKSRYGAIAVVATRPTSPGEPSSASAVTNGSTKTVTWLPTPLTVCPNQ